MQTVQEIGSGLVGLSYIVGKIHVLVIFIHSHQYIDKLRIFYQCRTKAKKSVMQRPVLKRVQLLVAWYLEPLPLVSVWLT